MQAKSSAVLWLIHDVQKMQRQIWDAKMTKCPNYRQFSEEMKEAECDYYGSHSGLCFFGGEYQNQTCPWKGRPVGKSGRQTCLL